MDNFDIVLCTAAFCCFIAAYWIGRILEKDNDN